MTAWQRIGANVTTLRKTAGLSFEAVGGRCRISPSSLLRIEEGDSTVDAGDLIKLASVLGTTPDALCKGVR
jgi:transcriptional regulator with XRE-family HTH domain